jgi:hypothetical protein
LRLTQEQTFLLPEVWTLGFVVKEVFLS